MNKDNEGNSLGGSRVNRKITKEEDESSQEREGPQDIKMSFIESEEYVPSRDEEEDLRDEDEDPDEDFKPKITPKPKKRYLQRYSSTFESTPGFKDWVRPSSKGKYYAYCIYCSTHLRVASGRTDLRKHSLMRKHQANAQDLKKSDNCITACIMGQDQPIATVELPVSGKTSKGRKYYQKYSHSYEQDPQFAGWVTASHKGDSFAHCIPCDTELSIKAGKMDLKRHAKNKKHIQAKAEFEQNMLTVKEKPDEPCIFLPGQEYSITTEDAPVQISASMRDDDEIQRSPITLEVSPFSRTVTKSNYNYKTLSIRLSEAELKIAAFIAEHDLPLTTADHLIQLIKTVCPDSIVAHNLEAGGTDTVRLINSVIGKESSDELMLFFKENKFSLIIDEAPGGLERHISLVVRVLHDSSVSEAFLGLLPIGDATPESLNNSIVDFFNKNGIPYKSNMLGIAVDGGNSLLAGGLSLCSLMKEDVPSLFVMKCISHSFSLCASAACLKLPHTLEDLVRDIYSYCQHSPNLLCLEEFRGFTEVKPHKLLHPSQTRWLSLHTVVSTILEKYDTLNVFFTEAALVDKVEAPETILQRLKSPLTKLYLMFLDFILPIFDNLDKQMQSESSKLHVIHNSVGVALNAIFECYLDENYLDVTPIKAVDFKDETRFKPLKKMYLGIKVQLEISNSVYLQSDLKDFQMNCLEFLIEGVSQIYERFPYGSAVFECLENVNPKVVIERNVPSLADLLYHFQHLAIPDIQVLDSEWRLLRNMVEILPVDSTMPPEVFWDIVSKSRQIDNTFICPNLCEFMMKMLCLPNSTAAVENIFSTINKIKRKSRNMSTETLVGLLYTKQMAKSKLALSTSMA